VTLRGSGAFLHGGVQHAAGTIQLREDEMATREEDLGGNRLRPETPGTGKPGQAVSQQAKDVTEQVKDVAQQTKDQVKDLASQAKDQTVEMAHQAQDQVTNLVAQQKEQAAQRLGGLAGALHDAAKQLEQKDADGFGRYAHRAADQVDKASRYLRDKDLPALVRDTESFARRHPDLFLGGSLVAGVLLARFLKSSAEHGEPWRQERTAGSDRSQGYQGYQDAPNRPYRQPGYPPAAMGGR
jgi:gas vesicle protein